MLTPTNTGLSTVALQQIVSVLSMEREVKEVILFGSRALGTYKPGSDIDLCIKGEVSHKNWLNLMIALDDLDLPYQYDLVLYKTIDSPALLDHIKTYGKILYFSET